MAVGYKGLEALCTNEDKVQERPRYPEKRVTGRREKAFTVLFDQMRRSLAVSTDSLDQAAIETLQRRSGLRGLHGRCRTNGPRIGAALVLDRSHKNRASRRGVAQSPRRFRPAHWGGSV